jgi:putative heme iron utilization protein
VTAPLDTLRALLDDALVASLAVLEDGAPSLSLVGFVVTRGPARFYLLLSELSAHTAALRADPRCSLMLHALPSPDDPNANHALTRLIVKGRARFLSRTEAGEAGATSRYRARYAIADTLLGLSDFHFVEIVPQGATFIAGFGRAYRVSGEDLEELEHVGGAAVK